MSLRNKLLKKIRTEGRLTYGAMCQFTVEEGYKVETAGRRLRELMEENLVFAERARSKRNTEYISAYTAKEEEKNVHNFTYDAERGCMIERVC